MIKSEKIITLIQLINASPIETRIKYIVLTMFDYCVARDHRCNISCSLSIHSKLGLKIENKNAPVLHWL